MPRQDMTRRRVVAGFVAGGWATSTAKAQNRPMSRRIAILWVVRPPADLIRDRLRELGWVEGRTIEIHERFAEGQPDRLPGLARELVALDPEVLVAVSGLAAEAAHAATTRIPIVMVTVGRPIEAGLIQSLARPGGNVTGTTSMTVEVAGKQIELLYQLVPRAKRIALLASRLNRGSRDHIEEVLRAAGSLDMSVVLYEIAAAADVAPALNRIEETRPDALLVSPEPLTFSMRSSIFEFAERMRLPAIYGLSSLARGGGLMSYAPSFDAQTRRSAEYIDRILRGAKPGDLPVEQPSVFELVVNLRAARAIGLDVPRAILDRADEIIE